jgi:DegV family protein with EDD domain
VPEPSTVLVADSADDRRRDLGLALYEGGYEVINAVNGVEALRFTAGLNPTLVVAHTGLEGMEPLDLHRRLSAMGLEVPPMLVLGDPAPTPSDDHVDGAFYFLESRDLEPERFLHQVRLLLLARQIGGELGERIDVLYGDLTRISIGDLLQVLQRTVITGHVTLSVGPEAGLWLVDGEVVDAHWSKVRGLKAFNRIAGLRGGSFVLSVEHVDIHRSIDIDLATLVSDAVDERFRLDEMFRQLPSLGSRVSLKMNESFFEAPFTDLERETLTHVQQAKNFGDLIDRVSHTDLSVLQAVTSLGTRGFLEFTEPEHRIHVVTDSTCDLLPSVARRNNISIVPLSILFDDAVYKDGIDMQPDRFYQTLRESSTFPSTSPPSKGEFQETFRRLVGSGDILSIHISRKQSLTAERAEEAVVESAEEFRALRDEAGGTEPPSIRVIDSKSNSVGLGMLVMFCARMAQRGLPLDEIIDRIEDIRERTHFLFVVDTLEYLQKGGRIGKAQALLGTFLGIKPILGQKDGEVVPVDKVRGGRRVHPRLLELLEERVDPKRPVFVATAHASAPLWGTRLKNLIVERFRVVEVFEGEIGPVVGAHAGPGTVGCILFQPTDEELGLLAPEPQ